MQRVGVVVPETCMTSATGGESPAADCAGAACSEHAATTRTPMPFATRINRPRLLVTTSATSSSVMHCSGRALRAVRPARAYCVA